MRVICPYNKLLVLVPTLFLTHCDYLDLSNGKSLRRCYHALVELSRLGISYQRAIQMPF